jgi:hypothetical protein
MSGGQLWLCLDGLLALPGSALPRVHWPAWRAGLRVLMLGPYLEIRVICVLVQPYGSETGAWLRLPSVWLGKT